MRGNFFQANGVYTDYVYDRDGNLVHTSKRHNAFVYRAGYLFNYVLRNYYVSGVRQAFPLSHPLESDRPIPLADPLFGQIYHAFGSGDVAWDVVPVEPQWHEDTLTSEFYRRVPDAVNYVKYGEGKAESGAVDEIIDSRRVVNDELVGRTEPDDWFVGQQVTITAGTNSGETRDIVAFEQIPGRIVVSPNFTNPIDSTSEYEISTLGILETSNCIEIRTTLPQGVPSDPFNDKDYREHAIFSGEDAHLTDGGLMMTKAHHPKVYKDESYIYVRFYKLWYTF